jgi:hypothetical protein
VRTITAAQQAVLDGAARADHVRVQIKDSGGTYRDLTTYGGCNFVDAVSLKQSQDEPMASAEITLLREIDGYSLAPLMSASPLNRALAYPGSYAPLIALHREIKVECAVVPADVTPESGDWMLVFRGRVQEIDWGEEQIKLSCLDVLNLLRNAFIREEKVYGFGEVGGLAVPMRIWQPSTAYALDEYVLPTEANRNGKFYKVTTAGTSGTTEPTWPASGTVSDNSVVHTFQAATTTSGVAVEKIIQALVTDSGSAVVVNVPSSPSWNLTPYIQKREPTLDAISTLAQQIGWDFRAWFVTSDFTFQFFAPDRSASVAVHSFGPSDYESIPTLHQDLASVANHWRVWYSDKADLDPQGNPKRKKIEVSDSTSITAYGRRFAEIAESSTSQIDTSTEATTLANAALSDTKDVYINQAVELIGGFPWAELGDYYEFTANGRHYDSAQNLAAYAIEHSWEEGSMRTRLLCRGKPSLGVASWAKVQVHPEVEPPRKEQLFESATGPQLTVVEVVGGVQMRVTGNPDKSALGQYYEFHLSQSSGFTPSSSTLRSKGTETRFTATNLTPGDTYYGKFVPYTLDNGKVVRAQPSAETSFVAGRAVAGHLSSEADYSRLPLNGGFETQANPSAAPDHWEVLSGAWGTNFSLVADSDGVSSGSCLLATVSSGTVEIATEPFPILGIPASASTPWYRFTAWAKRVAGTSGSSSLKFFLDTFTYDMSSGANNELVSLSGSWSGNWTEYGDGRVFASLGDRYARIRIRLEGSGETATARIDNVLLERLRQGTAVAEDETASTVNNTSSSFASLKSASLDVGQPKQRVVVLFNTSMHASWGSGSNAQVEFRCSIDGVSQGIRKLTINQQFVKVPVAMAWEGQAPASTKFATVLIEWRNVTSSTSTLTIGGSEDSMSLIAVAL